MARASELERPRPDPLAVLTSPTLVRVVALAVTLGAWTLLAHGAGGSGSGSGFLAAFAMWNVMMVAMMLPALTPWLGLFPPTGAALFAAGYFSVWAAYCAGAAAIQTGVGNALVVPRPAGGVLLIAAGIFELSPIKAACLDRCRSPFGQLLTRWRDGKDFFFRVGLGHGLSCIGCCWALMAIAFALGVMNLWWMAALTAVVTIEKLAPWGETASRLLGMGLVAWGLFVVSR